MHLSDAWRGSRRAAEHETAAYFVHGVVEGSGAVVPTPHVPSKNG